MCPWNKKFIQKIEILSFLFTVLGSNVQSARARLQTLPIDIHILVQQTRHLFEIIFSNCLTKRQPRRSLVLALFRRIALMKSTMRRLRKRRKRKNKTCKSFGLSKTSLASTSSCSSWTTLSKRFSRARSIGRRPSSFTMLGSTPNFILKRKS